MDKSGMIGFTVAMTNIVSITLAHFISGDMWVVIYLLAVAMGLIVSMIFIQLG